MRLTPRSLRAVVAALVRNEIRALALVFTVGCASRPPPAPVTRRPPVVIEPLRATPRAEGVLRAIPLADGATLTLRASGALSLTRGGSVESTVEVENPARCELSAWGNRGFARCEGEGREAFFAGEGAALGVFRGAMAQVIGGRDGRALARAGVCEPDRRVDEAHESAGCRWSAQVGWRTWTMDRPRAQLIDVYGQRALVRWTERTELPERPALAHEVVGLYDIDRGVWIPLTASEPTARWICAGFGDDGRVRALMHTGTIAAPRALRVIGEESVADVIRLQTRPLPFAAEDFAEVDELRMVLVRGDEAVLMRDATHVVPIRGEAPLRANPWRHATRCGERVRCEGARCAIDGSWELSLPPPRDPLAP